MKTLIIFDDGGTIYYQVTGDFITPQGGIQYLILEVPEGKYISGVDLSGETPQAILSDFPKSENEQLKENINDLQLALAELAETILGGTV